MRLRLKHGAANRRLPIASLLVFGLSGLVIVAVASVLYLGLYTSRTNTMDLARDRAELLTTMVQGRVDLALTPARDQVAYLADVIVKQHIDPMTDPRFLDMADGALGAARQITALAFSTPDYHLLRVFRGENGALTHAIDLEQSPAVRAAIDASRNAPGPYWGDIVWNANAKQPLINLRAPVRDGDTFVGTLYAVLSVRDLSAALQNVLTEFDATPFILIDHDYVLAHPLLVEGFPGQSAEHPLPMLNEIGDAVLTHIWDQGTLLERERSRRLIGGSAKLMTIDGTQYLFLYVRTIDYGPKPWVIGVYLPETTLSAAIDRLVRAVGAGALILVCSVLAALWVGRKLTQQIQSLAFAAHSVRNLEFGTAARLKPSVLRELDDAATAFNAMLDGLRWFETYVPRALVRRLVRLGGGALESVEREVTVMFTDIAGFTALSEKMSASEVADFLNGHFTILDRCIDGAGGTVDKHMGDGVMAFWGAPERQDDHAELAARAAHAIALAIAEDNARRRERGGIPVRLRIGLHSGPVTVGNVGGPSRMSYTIVGDTVNSAERLCELAKQVGYESFDTVALISGDTAGKLSDAFELAPFGEHVLRGRQQPTEIFRLVFDRGQPTRREPAQPANSAST